MEQNRARRTLFDVLTRVTHRLYGPMVADIRNAMRDDPDFTARWCVFANAGGSNIRDQQDAATIALLQAPSIFPARLGRGRRGVHSALGTRGQQARDAGKP